MPISKAPFSARHLPSSAALAKDAHPEGLFSSYLGQRYELEALRQTESYPEADEPYLVCVKAFPVPALIGTQFVIHQDIELPDAVAKLLMEKFPNIVWDATDVSIAPLRKYFLVHACLPAPEDVATGQAMALELYGELLSLDGVPLDSESGRQWRDQQIERYLLAIRQGQPEPELKGKMILEIRAATYANIMYLGVDMPFYL